MEIPGHDSEAADTPARHGVGHAEVTPSIKTTAPSGPPVDDKPVDTPLGGPAEPGEGPTKVRKRLRSFVAGASAFACAGALMASTVMPATIAAPVDSTAAAGRQQNIFTGGTTDDPAMLPPVSVSPVEAVPEPGADGAMSFSGLLNTKLRYPFDSEVSLTDPFGYRTVPVAQFHDAQDMAAGGGTPIRIIGDGVVREAGWASDGCGFALTVQHQVAGQAVTSRYCHMQADSHSYQVGQSVKSGDQAGLVGETGLAFGAHLHLAMRVENEPIDPLPFIAANSN